GIIIYMVTAELNEVEMFRPSILAKAEVVNRANQYARYISFIPRILLPIITNKKDWIAEIRKRIIIFAKR
ncbi:unnamed protein product, partial [marine sediment metagenome]